MNQSSRDDFFTLIHKGLRRELFAVTTLAATIDWCDPHDVEGFDARWRELRHLLEIHAAHEDEHFLPLLGGRAPEILDSLATEHDQQEAELHGLSDLISETVVAPTDAGGLTVHRQLSAFVAGYLGHLLEEETVVMPAIWEHCADEELASARAAFLAAMPPADAALSRRVMLPAMSPPERARMLTMLRAAAPAPAFAAVLDDARQHLGDRAWRRLAADLELQ